MNDNKHKWFEELMETYLAAGLTGNELSEFEAHRDECADCRKSLEKSQRFGATLLQALAMDKSPVDLSSNVASAMALSPAKLRGMGIWDLFEALNPMRLPRYVTGPALAILFIIVGMTVMSPGLMNARRTAPGHELSTLASSKGSGLQSVGKYVDSNEQKDSAGDENLELMKEEEDSLCEEKSKGLAAPSSPKPGWTGGDSDKKSYEGKSRSSEAPVNSRPGDSPYGESLAKNNSPSLRGTSGGTALSAGEPTAPDRKVIKSGSLIFEVESFEATYQRVTSILAEENGFIASSQSTKLPNGKVQGEIVIRVQPDRFDTVVLKLRSLGELKNQQVTSQDVTKQYVDLMGRLKNSKALEDRFIKLMSEKKGDVKDFLEVEKELANTREKIEQIQGEIKYYDSLVSLSTIRLVITEKDIAKPFEFVQTQSANLIITVPDVITAYQRAQAIILSVNGQVIEAQVNNQDKRVLGIVKAYANADQFTGLLEQLKGLGEVKSAVSEQRQSAPLGTPTDDKNTPVRRERGLVTLTLNLPAGEYIQTQRARIVLETSDVDGAYAKAQSIAQGIQAKVVNGNITRGAEQTVATVICQVPAEQFNSLVASFKAIAKVKDANQDEKQVAQGVDPKSTIQAPIRKEPGTIELTIASPTAIVTDDSGFFGTLRNTLKSSIRGLLASLELLVVGIVTLGPWIIVLILAIVLIKRWTGKKKDKSA
ncbi:MAG: DUF4349 domain-containing protein [Planctomycetota bacterium]